MRRLLLATLTALLVGAAPPYSGSITATTYSEAQACTAGTCAGSAPTFSGSTASAGAGFMAVTGYRLQICAAAGQTLSGAGTMQAYYCDGTALLCLRNPAIDQSVTATSRCQTFPDFVVPYVSEQYYDTIEFVASGVTVSGGASITEKIYVRYSRAI